MPLHAGSATTNLTPDRELPNYYHTVLRQGSGDADLLCHAVCVAEGPVSAAFVSCDALCLDRPLVLRIREEVARCCGIPALHVLLAATHTHASPATCPTFLAGALPDPLYLDFFVERVVAAVQQAQGALRPARLAAGTCPTPGFEFNRRFLRPGGRATMAPGRGSELPMAGPVDTMMQYLAFRDEQDAIVGVVVNYPCHNNCCNEGIYHRDLGGRAGDALRRRLAGEFATPFLPAPCGDIIWCDLRSPPTVRGDALAWQIGDGIAHCLETALGHTEWREEVALCLGSEIIEIPDRPLADSTLCDDDCRGESERAQEFARRRYTPEREAVAARGSTVCPVEIQAISLGDAAVVTNPAELFVAFGIEIKQRSPFATTLVSELTNGYCGYVPTEQAFEEGGYETHRSVYTSRLVREGGRRITEASLELLERVHGSRRGP